MVTVRSKNNGNRGQINLLVQENNLVACVSKSVSGGGVLYISIAPKCDRENTIAVVLNVDTWSKDKSVTIVYGPDLKNVTVDNVNTQEGFSKLINTINKLLNNLGINHTIAAMPTRLGSLGAP
jgi:hypothetical protein